MLRALCTAAHHPAPGVPHRNVAAAAAAGRLKPYPYLLERPSHTPRQVQQQQQQQEAPCPSRTSGAEHQAAPGAARPPHRTGSKPAAAAEQQPEAAERHAASHPEQEHVQGVTPHPKASTGVVISNGTMQQQQQQVGADVLPGGHGPRRRRRRGPALDAPPHPGAVAAVVAQAVQQMDQWLHQPLPLVDIEPHTAEVVQDTTPTTPSSRGDNGSRSPAEDDGEQQRSPPPLRISFMQDAALRVSPRNTLVLPFTTGSRAQRPKDRHGSRQAPKGDSSANRGRGRGRSSSSSSSGVGGASNGDGDGSSSATTTHERPTSTKQRRSRSKEQPTAQGDGAHVASGQPAKRQRALRPQPPEGLLQAGTLSAPSAPVLHHAAVEASPAVSSPQLATAGYVIKQQMPAVLSPATEAAGLGHTSYQRGAISTSDTSSSSGAEDSRSVSSSNTSSSSSSSSRIASPPDPGPPSDGAAVMRDAGAAECVRDAGGQTPCAAHDCPPLVASHAAREPAASDSAGVTASAAAGDIAAASSAPVGLQATEASAPATMAAAGESPGGTSSATTAAAAAAAQPPGRQVPAAATAAATEAPALQQQVLAAATSLQLQRLVGSIRAAGDLQLATLAVLRGVQVVASAATGCTEQHDVVHQHQEHQERVQQQQQQQHGHAYAQERAAAPAVSAQEEALATTSQQGLMADLLETMVAAAGPEDTWEKLGQQRVHTAVVAAATGLAPGAAGQKGLRLWQLMLQLLWHCAEASLTPPNAWCKLLWATTRGRLRLWTLHQLAATTSSILQLKLVPIPAWKLQFVSAWQPLLPAAAPGQLVCLLQLLSRQEWAISSSWWAAAAAAIPRAAEKSSSEELVGLLTALVALPEGRALLELQALPEKGDSEGDTCSTSSVQQPSSSRPGSTAPPEGADRDTATTVGSARSDSRSGSDGTVVTSSSGSGSTTGSNSSSRGVMYRVRGPWHLDSGLNSLLLPRPVRVQEQPRSCAGHHLLQRWYDLLPQLTPAGLALSTWAVARLALQPPQHMVLALSQRVLQEEAGSWPPQLLDRMVWAWCQLYRNSWWQQQQQQQQAGQAAVGSKGSPSAEDPAAVDSRVYRRNGPAEIVGLGQEAAAAAATPRLTGAAAAITPAVLPPVFELCLWQLLQQAGAQVETMSLASLATICSSLAALNLRPPVTWLQQVAAQARVLLPQSSPRAVSSFVWSLGLLGYRPGSSWMAELLQVTQRQLYARTYGPEGLAALGEGLRRLGQLPSEGWVTHYAVATMHAVLRRRQRPCSLQQLYDVGRAMAHFCRQPGSWHMQYNSWWEEWGEHVQKQLPGAPCSLAVGLLLMASSARLQLPGSWWAAWFACTGGCLKKLTRKGLLMVGWAVLRLQQVPPQPWLHTWDALLSSRELGLSAWERAVQARMAAAVKQHGRI